MHNGKFVPTQDQENLIRSLAFKFQNEPQKYNPLVNHESLPIRDQNSLGTITDNLKFIQQNICACGKKTETLSHSTMCNVDGSAIDSYHVNCGSCGKEEKVNFHMLTRALREKNDQIKYNKKSILYPYL